MAESSNSDLFSTSLVFLGYSTLTLGLNTGAVSAIYGFRTGRKIYDQYHAAGPGGVEPGDVLLTLALLGGVFAAWRMCTNGKRMIDAGLAPDADKRRTILALKTWKRSEKVGSPSLRFLTFLLPVWFNAAYAIGTYAVYTLTVPVGSQVLPHYFGMTFMGMALATYSWSYSRFEGVDLRAPENAALLAARGPAEPRSKVRGFLLRVAGIWACMLGPLMMIDAFVLVYRAQSAATTGWRFFFTTFAIFFLYFGLGVLTAGKSLLRHSRRHLTRVISAPDDLRGESFVLYLRPFRSDALQGAVQRDHLAGPVNNIFTSGRSEEEQVAVLTKHLGPMVAVGMPGEQLPHAGAFRMYLPRDGWQEPVRTLIAQARLVVLALGPGEGTRWELREAMRVLPPQKLVLLVPMAAAEYAAFRETVAAEPRGLPAYREGKPALSVIKAAIYFGPDWTPKFVGLGDAPIRLSHYHSVLLSTLRTSLRPAFAQLSAYERARDSRPSKQAPGGNAR